MTGLITTLHMWKLISPVFTDVETTEGDDVMKKI